MSDYIDRDKLKKRFCSHCESYCVPTGCTEGKCFDLKIIDSIPAADVVERKRGKWISAWHDFFRAEVQMCSCCKGISVYKTNYCQYCGTLMTTE